MRLVIIAVALALALPAAASAAGSEPTPSTPTPTPPTQSAPAPAPAPPATTTAPGTTAAPAPTAPAKHEQGSATPVWPLAILAALLVLCAVFAGLAWWFGWSAERFLGRGGASWRSFEELGDWIRTGY